MSGSQLWCALRELPAMTKVYYFLFSSNGLLAACGRHGNTHGANLQWTERILVDINSHLILIAFSYFPPVMRLISSGARGCKILCPLPQEITRNRWRHYMQIWTRRGWKPKLDCAINFWMLKIVVFNTLSRQHLCSSKYHTIQGRDMRLVLMRVGWCY